MASVVRELRFILVRHGQSTFNKECRLQGNLVAPPLTELGRAQATETGAALASSPYVSLGEKALCSPLNRAVETAEEIRAAFIAAKRPFPKLQVLESLHEIDLLSWEGRPRDEVEKEQPDAYWKWRHDPLGFQLDGRFPVRELWQRARNVWPHMLQEAGDAKTEGAMLIVGHYCMHQALLCTAFGRDERSFWKFPWPNGAALEIIWEANGPLHSENGGTQGDFPPARRWRWLHPNLTNYVDAGTMSTLEIGLQDAVASI